jgi:hypothetical protein
LKIIISLVVIVAESKLSKEIEVAAVALTRIAQYLGTSQVPALPVLISRQTRPTSDTLEEPVGKLMALDIQSLHH